MRTFRAPSVSRPVRSAIRAARLSGEGARDVRNSRSKGVGGLTASAYASDCITGALPVITSPLRLFLTLLFSRNLATRFRFASCAPTFVTIFLYFSAFNTSHPPSTRSILRPSNSGSPDSLSGASSILTASFAARRLTFALRARFAIAAKWQKPVSSIAAIMVIQTMRVASGSSQIEESRIFVKILLYMLIP